MQPSYANRTLFSIDVWADQETTPILLDDGQYPPKNGVGTPRRYYVQFDGSVSTTPIAGYKDGTLLDAYPTRDSLLASVNVYTGPFVVCRDGSPIHHPGESASPTYPDDYVDYRAQDDGTYRKFGVGSGI